VFVQSEALKKGYKSTAGIYTHVLQPLLGTAAADIRFGLIKGIIPDFLWAPFTALSAAVISDITPLRDAATLHPGHRGCPDAPLKRPHATPCLASHIANTAK